MGYLNGQSDSWWLHDNGNQAENLSDTYWHLHVLTSSDSDQVNFWSDLSQKSTNSSAGHNAINYPGQISFGAWRNLQEASAGEIAEFLLFDKILTTNERQEVETYLVQKWNLQDMLLFDHPGNLPTFAGQLNVENIIPTPSSISFSNDGSLTFIGSFSDQSVALFERNAFTGDLSFIDKIKNGENGVSSLAGPSDIVAAYDGDFVYVASSTDSSLNKISTDWKPSMLNPQVWFDASDLDADGVTDSLTSSNISQWNDKSANGYHASGGGNQPYLNATGGPNERQSIEIRGGEFLNVNGTFFAKDHFYVFRSPPANWRWSGYGGVLGHNPTSGHNQRNSNYITHHNSKRFHQNQYPSAVWKFGESLSSPFDLSPINQYMVVRLKANNNDPGPYNSYQIGRSSGLQCNLDICEIIAFNSALSDEDADKVEGYLAQKWGLSGELEEVHPYKYLTPRSLSIQQTVTNGTDGASGMDGINKISLSSDGSQIIATSTNDNSLIYF